MGTRAIICMKFGDKHKGILCSMDGYPSHTLKILKKFYNTPELVEKLISGGDIRSLQEKYEPNPLGEHNLEDSQPKVTNVYLRDNNKTLSEEDNIKYIINFSAVEFNLKDFSNIEKFKYYDYIYIFTKKWVHRNRYK